tara:strand:- start:3155 stop:6598 length:3444 start_codon:yes stop_codon:yes gene_type:complete
MPKKADKDQLLKNTFLTLKDDQSGNVRRIISVPELQIGLSSSAMGPRGLIMPPHTKPANTSDRLYNEGGTLKFGGVPLFGGVMAIGLAADGGTVAGDTSITFSGNNTLLTLTASDSVTLTGNSSNKSVSIELSGGAGTGNVTMASQIDADNVVVTTNGTSGRAIQQANATITTDGQAMQINSDTGLSVGASSDFGVSVSSGNVNIANGTADKDLKFFINDSDGGGSTELVQLDGSESIVRFRNDAGITAGAGDDLKISLSSDDVYIENTTQDKDIYVRANHGGSTTNLIQLDGSEADIVVNPSSDQDVDFIAKTQNKGYGVFVDSSADQLKLGSQYSKGNEDTSDGGDIFFFVSGAIGGRGVTSGDASKGISVFGGDIFVSGTAYNSFGMPFGGGWTDSGTVVRLTTPTDRVGIGTSTPSGTLDIKGDGSTSQVFILSGSGAKSSLDESSFSDINFFVSGSVGSRGSSTKGTSLFGGDVVVSGTLYAEKYVVEVNETVTGSLMVSGSLIVSQSLTAYGHNIRLGPGGPSPAHDVTASIRAGLNKNSSFSLLELSPGQGQEFGGTGAYGFRFLYDGSANELNLDAAATTTVYPKLRIDRNTPKFFILSGAGSSPSSGNEWDATDTNFFVSGAVDSRDTTVRGTSVFGGDVAISGTLAVNLSDSSVGSQFVVTTDGKVGIGTSTPSYKLSVGGNMDLGEYLYHKNDANTYMRFEGDKITFAAGGETLLTMQESTQDIVTVGDGGDVDFQVKTSGGNNTLYVQGSSDRIGIGLNNPSSLVHLKDSSPAIRLQRSAQTNSSTLEFAGAANVVGSSIVHEESTNDLVFRTFGNGGSSLEEIVRLGGYYTQDNRRIVLLSGSGMHVGAMQPREMSDISFFISGAIGSRGTSSPGTSVFGGDTLISGSLYGGRWYGTVNALPIKANQVAVYPFQSDVYGQHLGMGTDVNFFVSGTAGSRGISSTVGTSVFAGDVVVSGTLYGGSPLKVDGGIEVTGTMELKPASGDVAIVRNPHGPVKIFAGSALKLGSDVGIIDLLDLGDGAAGQLVLTGSGGVSSRSVEINSPGTLYFTGSAGGSKFKGNLNVAGSIYPSADTTYDLGSDTNRWANIYTGDLHLKNDRGNWTIVEELEYLCVVNNTTGKKYKMVLQPLEDDD